MTKLIFEIHSRPQTLYYQQLDDIAKDQAVLALSTQASRVWFFSRALAIAVDP